MRTLRRPSRATIVTCTALALILVAAAVIRFADLATQPGGLYPDEAAEGFSALRILHSPGFPVWFTDDGGREALYAYVVAAAFNLFGVSTVVLRGVSAGIGVAAVAATFVAVVRFGRFPAIVAAAWAAGSVWLVAVSRDGMRNIICVLVGMLVLAALMRLYDKASRRSAVLAGIYIGLGLWTYQPLKLVQLVLILWLLWMRRHDAARYASMHALWKPLVIAFAVVAAPMMFIAVTDPSSYFGRGAEVSAFNPGQPDSGFIAHTLATLGQFFVTGDPNPRHDVAQQPLLGIALSVVAAFGVWRCIRLRADAVYVLLLIAAVVFMIPPLIAIEGGAPHFLRNLGEAPVVASLVGVGAVEIATYVRGKAGRLASVAATTLVAAAVIAGGGVTATTYFSRPASAVYDAYSWDVVQEAQIADHGPGTLAIIDDYNAFDIEFLDWDNLPTFTNATTRLPDPDIYSLIVATRPSDIAQVTGDPALAARAHVVAWDPGGAPRVWAVVP